MAKIIVSDKLSVEGVKILQDAGFSVDCKFGIAPEELKKIIGEYDAIVIRSGTKITADIIANPGKLKVIGRAGVGVDNVDLDAAKKKGIIVMNAPGGNTISTCEHAIALMFSIARNIPFAHNSLMQGKWERSKLKGTELTGKTLGIVGLGRIGREVAKRAIGLGMQVLGSDPFVSKELAEKAGIEMAELETIFKNADFLTVHSPLTEKTKNLIAEKEIKLMKSSAFIINDARGGIINEDALYNALKEKRIAGAALDVFVSEPLKESKFFELDNIVLTPHLGASTEEAQLNVAIEVAHCVKDALNGKAIRNAVNYVQLDADTYQIVEPYFSLAEKMGKFISQVAEGGLKEVQISYLGEISAYKVDVIGAAFIKGMYDTQLESDVNYINALEIAKERGVKVEQIKNRDDKEYVNAIRVKVVTDKEERFLEGTLFANKQARFVKMDDFYLEVAPTDNMIVIYNHDKPGTIGFLGTLLGKYGINIAGMSLGRNAPEGIALTILNLDNPVKDDVIREIKAHSNIVSVQCVVF
ncbi:MAG: phosphoglycerate dehydrogenase [Candidatus Omnitrophica bacterium]|nr:phosphoglycerate dehydrogenase [Candidatus Omnitrophota bacterium]MDD5080381.1 phosphoglycerate dehydrogenase [Candidatus Omnitrophota bacterium]MDD5440890.1 phosphoglycerate dehydrogenase [Candidatus Omnitrophota bacterium]